MKSRLTKHQAEVFSRIQRYWGRYKHLSQGVPAYYIGSRGACQHLVQKGYITEQIFYGPRGGEEPHYFVVEVTA